MIDYFETHYASKIKIVHNIEQSLKKKVEAFVIIGSFLSKEWTPLLSDLDIICIDSSFSDYPHCTNIKYIQSSLSHLNYRFDIKMYTWEQLRIAIKRNPRLHHELKKGIKYGILDI